MDNELRDGPSLPAVHVYPLFGPEHRFEHLCWCCPEYELQPGVLIVVHNTMH